jgi:hypothetical protein
MGARGGHTGGEACVVGEERKEPALLLLDARGAEPDEQGGERVDRILARHAPPRPGERHRNLGPGGDVGRHRNTLAKSHRWNKAACLDFRSAPRLP